jgi:hypothetical protein
MHNGVLTKHNHFGGCSNGKHGRVTFFMSILHSPIQAHRLPSTLRIKEDWFVDEHERCVLLRGVNVCGTSKIPNNTAAYWMNSPKFW